MPSKPNTIGEHIRRRRLQLHLFQADLAKLFGVDIGTIRNWEQGVYQPVESLMPCVIVWLGYDPRPRFRVQSGSTYQE